VTRYILNGNKYEEKVTT